MTVQLLIKAPNPQQIQCLEAKKNFRVIVVYINQIVTYFFSSLIWAGAKTSLEISTIVLRVLRQLILQPQFTYFIHL